MIKRLYGEFLGGRPAIGLLIFRIVTGLALMQHGMMKMAHPFSWMPGHVPGIFQFLSIVAEFGGGLALLLGLLTPIACIGIAINMLVAIFMVHVPHGGGWVGKGSTYESALGYLVAAVMLFLTGPGVYSLDRKFFGEKTAKTAAGKKPDLVALK